MKPTRNLKNILSLFSVDLGSKFIGFLATTYLARILGTSGFGVINIGLAVLVYVLILSTSGLELTGTKKTAAGNEDPDYLAGNIITLRIFLTLIVVSLTFVVSNFFITSDEIRLIVIVYILFAFPSAFLLDWFFSGIQKLEITSAGRITGSLVYFIMAVILVKTSEDIIYTAVAWVIGGVANTIFIWFFYKKYGYKVKIRFDSYKKSFKLLKESSPLGLASFLSQAAIMFPAIYLGIVSSTSEAGIYSAAYKFIALLLIFDRVFVTIFFPKIVNAISHTPARLEEIFNRAFKIISVLVLTISIPIVLTGDLLINLVFGMQFQESVILFQVLIAFFVFTLINSVFSYTLIAVNREGAYLFALTVSVFAFIISTIIFYSQFFTLGIVFALIIYEIIQTLIMIIKIKETISLNYLRSLVSPMLVSVIILSALLNIEIHLIYKILIALFFGIPMVAYSGGLKTEDIKYIKRLLI